MASAKRFDAVVFDLDGTLVDTAPDLAQALNHTLARHGLATLAPADVRPMIGDGARAMLRRGLAAAGTELEAARFETLAAELLAYYWDHVAVRSRPFPGVVDALDRLAAGGVKCAVCTNKPFGLTERLLRLLQLWPRFQAVLGGDSLPVRKPDPGHLLGTLDRLQVPPERAVMVGDSANDVNVARGAGVAVVVVSFGYTAVPAAELGADAVIDHFEGLPQALARLS